MDLERNLARHVFEGEGWKKFREWVVIAIVYYKNKYATIQKEMKRSAGI